MQYKVTITFKVETDDYHNVGSSRSDARELVYAMLRHEADLPDKREINVGVASEDDEPYIDL